MYKSTAVLGSMTTAMKAQKRLASAAIRSTVVKLDSSVTKRGCAYGIEFDSEQMSNVRVVLENAGIKVSRYLNGGDTV